MFAAAHYAARAVRSMAALAAYRLDGGGMASCRRVCRRGERATHAETSVASRIGAAASRICSPRSMAATAVPLPSDSPGARMDTRAATLASCRDNPVRPSDHAARGGWSVGALVPDTLGAVAVRHATNTERTRRIRVTTFATYRTIETRGALPQPQLFAEIDPWGHILRETRRSSALITIP